MSNDKIKKRYNRIAPIYDQLELIMEKAKFKKWRIELWSDVQEYLPEKNGKLLEAGVGTGKNIQYYPDNTDEIYAIDFSEKMLKLSQKKVNRFNKNVELKNMDIEKLDFESNYFDVIVTSCVFCSVPDPIKGLKELKRVLKPSGRIIMLEHMRSSNEVLGTLLDIFNGVSLHLWGANINRKTVKNIQAADLDIVENEDLWADIFKKIVLKK